MKKSLKGFYRLFAAVCIFNLIVFSFGCSERSVSEPDNTEKQTPVVPLSVGNYWNYNTKDSIHSTGQVFNYNTFFCVYGDTVINNERWYLWGPYEKSDVWYINKQYGLISLSIFKSGDETSIRIDTTFKYPVILGDKYKNLEVLSVNEKVAVPVGTFSCIHFRYTIIGNPSDIIDEYFAPGIGRIKTVSNSILNGSKWTYTLELIEYQIKN